MAGVGKTIGTAAGIVSAVVSLNANAPIDDSANKYANLQNKAEIAERARTQERETRNASAPKTQN